MLATGSMVVSHRITAKHGGGCPLKNVGEVSAPITFLEILVVLLQKGSGVFYSALK